MPLRGLDFSRSNQAIARFNQFLQYDLMDQLRSDRDVGILQISDRLQRERQREAGQIEAGIAEFKSALTDKEAYIKAMLDISKLPEADYLMAMARLATDPNLPPQYHDAARNAAKKYASIAIPLAQAYYNASRGIGTATDAFNALQGGGVAGLTDYMKESGMNLRAQQVAKTAEDEQRLGYAKIAADVMGRTATAVEKKETAYIKWVDDTINFLVGEGVQGEALIGDMPIYLETKTRDPLSSTDRGKALTYLNRLKGQILNEGYASLTPGNLEFISKVWNTPAVQGYVSERLKGGTPSPAPAAGQRPRPGAAQPAPPSGAVGQVNPETGATVEEENEAFAAIRRTLINQRIQDFMGVTGLGLEDAKKYAT